jgi:hypothetical protein
MDEVGPEQESVQPPASKKRTPRARSAASNVTPPDVIRKTEEHIKPAESPEERDSRLRREESAANFGHIKESILLAVICVIAVASLIGALSPWLDNDSRAKAFLLLTTIATGAGTYLFTRQQDKSR